jgi:regulator of sigma E protease
MIPELNKSTGAGQIGVVSWVDPVIAEIQPGSSAEMAGLKSGDIITALNGNPVEHTAGIGALLEEKPAAVSVTVNRKENVLSPGTELTFPLLVTYDEEGNLLLGIGFRYETREMPRYSFFPALWKGVTESYNMLVLTAKGIVLLFKGVDVTQAVSGPVRITIMLGDVVQSGFSAGFSIGIVSALNFLALISISLFMMNLLPIPILDGGLILFAIIELIKRRGVSPKTLYRVQFIGVGFILMVFAVALFGDIRYLFTR